MASESKALYNLYRPTSWDGMVGQEAAIKSMRSVIENRSAQTFLLIGPSGCGKTTLARIACNALGCTGEGRVDYDAASNTGVDDARKLADAINYLPFGSDVRCIVVDECHRLSGQAWDSLLMVTEEPPKHVFWFFCTTNPAKVPETIKTRCHKVVLKPLTDRELGSIYDAVADEENIPDQGDVADLIIREAKGSARQLLVNLAACRDTDSKKEAASILQTAIETDDVIAFCRVLINNPSWSKLMDAMKRIENEEPESVRIIASNYVAACLRKAKSEKEAVFFLNVLEAFADPYHPAAAKAGLLRSMGRVSFG